MMLGAMVGAGAILLSILGTCVRERGSSAQEPDRLKRKVNAMVKDLIRDHWNAMRKAVEQVSTDEGAKAFYAANPGLAPRIPTESAFLKVARSWRPLLQPLPEALPELETHDLSYVKKADGAEMSYRTPKGTKIFMKWSEDRLIEMRVY